MQIASKRPLLMAGLLFLLASSTQEGCRCRRGPASRARDGGAGPAPTAWLSGSVVDRRDHPVPEGGGPLRETISRAGGGFAFGGLGAGRYAVRAIGADGLSPPLRAVEASDSPAPAPIELELAPGRGVAGRVIDDAGTALAGVP